MNRLVLDASVVVAWFFDDQATPYSEAILDLLAGGGEGIVPNIWLLEIANALLIAERRQRTTLADVTSFLARLGGFAIEIDPPEVTRVFEDTLSVARQCSLTAYDAAYVELAIRERLPLATLDREMRKAANLVGVAIASP